MFKKLLFVFLLISFFFGQNSSLLKAQVRPQAITVNGNGGGGTPAPTPTPTGCSPSYSSCRSGWTSNRDEAEYSIINEVECSYPIESEKRCVNKKSIDCYKRTSDVSKDKVDGYCESENGEHNDFAGAEDICEGYVWNKFFGDFLDECKSNKQSCSVNVNFNYGRVDGIGYACGGTIERCIYTCYAYTLAWIEKSGRPMQKSGSGDCYTGPKPGTKSSCGAPFPNPNPVDANCGDAARTYKESETSFSGSFCNTGTLVNTPPFPSPCGRTTWTCGGAFGGSSATCTATRQLDAKVGSAHLKKLRPDIKLEDYVGPSLLQCAKGDSNNTTFPAKGQRVDWTCLGCYGGKNDPGTICRNNYVPQAETKCPEPAEFKNYPRVGLITSKSYSKSASNCANPKACEVVNIPYSIYDSSGCRDASYPCYRPKICSEVNDSSPGGKPQHWYTTENSSLPGDPYKFFYIEGNPDGDNNACYRKAGCGEIKTNVANATHENFKIEGECAASELTIYSGYHDGRLYDQQAPHIPECVSCVETTASWFQAVDGHAFGQDGINVSLPVVDPSDPKGPNSYFLRSSDSCEVEDPSKKSGLPITVSRSIITMYGERTYRTIPQTQALESVGAPLLDKADFAYFQSRVPYDSLATCSDLNVLAARATPLEDGSRACKLSATGSNITGQILTIPAGQKYIVFVEGDLNIDGKNTNIQVSSGGYLAFIVKGNITFGPEVGEEINDTLAAECNQKPIINGVFVADGKINVPGDKNPARLNPYTRRNCDKRITLAGNYIGWQGIYLSRDLKSCMNSPNLYPDYNDKTPVITFTHRPDLLLNTPLWMKKVWRMRLEVS